MRFRDEEPRYGFERGVRLNFSIVNTNETKLRLDHAYLRNENHFPCRWGLNTSLIQLNLLCESLDPSLSPIYVEAHGLSNFGINICSFCWEQSWDWDEDSKLPIFEKFGPPKVVSSFPDKIVGTEDNMEDVFKSFIKNNFKIFDDVKFDICITLCPATERHSVCIETIIYKNRPRFVCKREDSR